MRKNFKPKSKRFYSFIDFAEDYGEIVLLPLILGSIYSFYEATIAHKNEFRFLLDVLLLFIVLIALSCIVLKRINKLHVIWIREIPNLLIFWLVFGLYFVIRVFQESLTSQFTRPASQILFGLVAGTISLLLLLFQTKPWLKIRYRGHYEKIEFLKQKAKLKKDEWLALKYQLVDIAKERNRKSWGWRMIEILFIIALASLLDAYSGEIADMIQNVMP